ncbi:hypothetical protein RND81_08G057800 [Saponaria officinalis]|uniref:Arf-GAP domain-containing protein n=1 Tax=Saponaria officinalis TaxID=3572 RepID=A0AAW1J4G1_SAPOF
MASRLKEDEKNERIIRGLLKQPGNRRCINCNLLGPQYVCITFSTFVCTTCGGIHREFTHRVKSVSMAKFSQQEIAALQAGGNERAKEIYFKEWDSQRLNALDSSNVDKLRTFIKHVYVDRRYTGERSIDRPAQVKMGDKEEPTENRRSDPYQSGSRSPPYVYERRYSDRPSPGHDVRGSPGQDNRRHSDYGRSPVRSGIVSDWRREDRFSNGRRSDDRHSSDGEFKPEIRSPDSQNDSSISSPPAVRPVRDILGENVVPLRISEPPKANGARVAEGTVITQRTASSSSLASSNGNPTEVKSETSLIDFDASSEPVAAAQAQQSIVGGQSVTQATSPPEDDNWACFDNVTEQNVSQTPPLSNSFESVLSELAIPAPVSNTLTNGGVAPTPSNDMFPSSSSSSVDFLFDYGASAPTTALRGASVTSSFSTVSSYSSGGVAAGHGLAPTMPANGGAQWRGMQIPQQPSTVAVNQPFASQLVSGYPSGLSSQGVAGNSITQAPQAVPAPAVQTAEAEANRRQALPADLFTATSYSVPYQGPGWQTGLVPSMRFPMQYNTAMSTPTFPQPIRSANPFDANAEAPPAQAAFPSMLALHTALPNMAAPGGSLIASSLAGAGPSLMSPQPSSYPSVIPPHGPSFGPSMPGGYTGQQLHSNMSPSRPQGFGSFGNEGTPFGSFNPSATTPNPALGGNPFG